MKKILAFKFPKENPAKFVFQEFREDYYDDEYEQYEQQQEQQVAEQQNIFRQLWQKEKPYSLQSYSLQKNIDNKSEKNDQKPDDIFSNNIILNVIKNLPKQNQEKFYTGLKRYLDIGSYAESLKNYNESEIDKIKSQNKYYLTSIKLPPEVNELINLINNSDSKKEDKERTIKNILDKFFEVTSQKTVINELYKNKEFFKKIIKEAEEAKKKGVNDFWENIASGGKTETDRKKFKKLFDSEEAFNAYINKSFYANAFYTTTRESKIDNQFSVLKGDKTKDQAQTDYNKDVQDQIGDDGELKEFYSQIKKSAKKYEIEKTAERLYAASLKDPETKNTVKKEKITESVGAAEKSGINLNAINKVSSDKKGNTYLALNETTLPHGLKLPVTIKVDKNGETSMITPYFDEPHPFSNKEELSKIVKLAEYNAILSQIVKKDLGQDEAEKLEGKFTDKYFKRFIESFEKISVGKNKKTFFEQITNEIVNREKESSGKSLLTLSEKTSEIREQKLHDIAASLTNKEQDDRAEGGGNEHWAGEMLA